MSESMIKINLLPVKQIKQLQRAWQEVILFLAVLSSLLVLLGLVGFVRVSEINSRKDSVKALENERASYNSTINEIEQLKKQKALLETKLEVIQKLKMGSQLTVRVLDELANIMPPNRLWLNTMSLSGGSMNLAGVALDNATIAEFMRKVDGSPYFAEANLAQTSLTSVAGRKLKAFSLSCQVTSPVPEEPADAKQ